MAVTILTDQNFDEEITNFEGVALVDYWAEWCGPCRLQGPIIEELAQDLEGNEKIKIAKLNVDENQQTAQRFQIMSIPTLIIFKDGEQKEMVVGVNPKDVLASKINSYL